jgi:hypothetical protein
VRSDFLGEGGSISEAKLRCKKPEKKKIGGIFSDLLSGEIKMKWPGPL